MDLNNEQSENQTEGNAEGTETATEGATETPTLESINKAYFSSAELENASTAIETATEIATANNVDVTYNFDIEAELEDGYGIVIDHISKRGATGNTIVGILVAAIPDFETVMAKEDGEAFIKAAVSDKMIAKLKNAVRPRGEDGEVSASVPFSVEDFITSNRPEGILLAFRSLAGAYVKMLKKKGLPLMTEAILRQALQSSAFAEQNFPKVTQDKWVTILDSMIKKTTDEKKAVGILAEWKATRDSAELINAEVDLTDLDFDKL